MRKVLSPRFLAPAAVLLSFTMFAIPMPTLAAYNRCYILAPYPLGKNCHIYGKVNHSAPENPISVLYREYLGREAGPDEIAYWQTYLQQGYTVQQVAQLIMTSDEYFLRSLYLNILGRQPDAAGFAFWANVLKSGTSRAAVQQYFLDSPEYHARIGR